MNNDFSTSETVDLAICHACGAEARAHDRFCRRCGVAHLGGHLHESTTPILPEPKTLPLGQRYNTNPLAPVGQCQSVSGSLVQAVVAGVSPNALAYMGNRVMRHLLPALLLLPIWLMILLLSPLDAYVSAKTLTRGF
jgi:hypothetical protein